MCGASLALVGCAGMPGGLPMQALQAPAPFVPQDDTLCGPAVLASLLAVAGAPVDLATLTQQVYLPGRQGSLQLEMLAAPRRHGRLALAVPGGLAGAAEELRAGLPLGLLLNLSLPLWPRWHYAVLTGLDGPQGQAVLHSGLQADARWSLGTLEATWARSGHWALVVPPPGRLPATARLDATLPALLALDRGAEAAHKGDVALAWAAAARRWPEEVTLAIGEANAWTAAQRWPEAEQALRHTIQRFDSAVAWNNLALLLQRRGDRAGALAAAHTALQRAQAAEPHWLATTRRTLAEIDR